MIRNLSVIIILCCGFATVAQTQSLTRGEEANKCVRKGKVLLDVYFGAPFFYKSVLRNTYQESFESNALTSTNHLGLRAGIMLSDHVDIGLEGTYAKATVATFSNPSHSAGITKYRVLAKINLHFSTTSVLDPYVTLGAGYSSLVYYQTFPGISNLKTNQFVEDFVPVAIRAGIGARFFFFKGLGGHMEVGIGGPLVQVGLSFKI